jgi:hypothetical protein
LSKSIFGGDANDGEDGELTPRPPKHLHPSVITRYAEAELLGATVSLLKQFPNAQVCHVYGHQDDDMNMKNFQSQPN